MPSSQENAGLLRTALGDHQGRMSVLELVPMCRRALDCVPVAAIRRRRNWMRPSTRGLRVTVQRGG
jgi:hypothetical protein